MMAKFRKIMMWISCALAVLIPLYFMGSALGAKFGVFDWRFSFGVLIRNIGSKILMAGAVIGALSVLLVLITRFKKPKFGATFMVALLAWGVPLIGLYQGASFKKTAGTLPVIHDISSDVVNPPNFSAAMMTLRTPKSNSVDYLTKIDYRSKQSNAAAQQAAYGDIQTLKFDQATDEVFAKALRTAQAMGWDIVTNQADQGSIEATDATFWFGFKDDVIIRILPITEEAGAERTKLDIRSVSRVGGSDIGTNAKRIRAYVAKLALK